MYYYCYDSVDLLIIWAIVIWDFSHTHKWLQSDFLWSCSQGNGTPLQYSCLENPVDRGAWKAAVHRIAKGWARLKDFTFTFHCHALEKEMATHSSILAWRIPGMGEPGGLLSMGSHRVGHDWSDLAAADIFFTFLRKSRFVLFKKIFSPFLIIDIVFSHSVMSDSSWPHGL